MIEFERENPNSPYYHEDTPNTAHYLGTPLGESSSDFREYFKQFEDYRGDADAFIYVIGLLRLQNDSTWFYIGQSDSGKTGLKNRLRSHIRNFTQERPARQAGVDVLSRDGGTLLTAEEEYRVIGVDRIESLAFDEGHLLESFASPPRVPRQVEDHIKARINEMERRISYETAVEHGTPNILGGK